MARDVNHRKAPALRGDARGENRIRDARLRVSPAGENCGRPKNRILVIGGDGETTRAKGEAAVEIEIVKADREKLHDFARVVLVR